MDFTARGLSHRCLSLMDVFWRWGKRTLQPSFIYFPSGSIATDRLESPPPLLNAHETTAGNRHLPWIAAGDHGNQPHAESDPGSHHPAAGVRFGRRGVRVRFRLLVRPDLQSQIKSRGLVELKLLAGRRIYQIYMGHSILTLHLVVILVSSRLLDRRSSPRPGDPVATPPVRG